MSLRGWFLCVVVTALGCSALQTDCPPIGCYDSVTVDLKTASGKRFPTGDYTISVTADRIDTTATCSVPAASTSGVTCHSDKLTEITSDAEHIYVVVMFKANSVTVKIAASGTQLAETTFVPEYGPRDECDTCFHAKSTLTVTP